MVMKEHINYNSIKSANLRHLNIIKIYLSHLRLNNIQRSTSLKPFYLLGIVGMKC